ncbi:MAG TPA: hypothetical protein VIT42_11495 [Microlunatus sp.]
MARSTTGRYELEAKSAARELWAVPQWHGKGVLGPWVLADGREILDLIATGTSANSGSPSGSSPTSPTDKPAI